MSGTIADARKARENGANGIGLCRSEQMFFKPERILKLRQLILGSDKQAEEALHDLLQFQRKDYAGIYKEMEGLPVTVRLLDPPLHEFLPSLNEEVVLIGLAKQLGFTIHELKEKVRTMQEVNPMLGLRGCRLGVTRPLLVEMQVRAILEAALNSLDDDIDAMPDIMVPLVGTFEEFHHQRKLIESVANKVFKEHNRKTCSFKIGTMIEVPRPALITDEIAAAKDGGTEFFSFGSNYLNEKTSRLYSRDDASRSFVPDYLKKGILQDDPFVTGDTKGVGQLIKMAVDRSHSVQPDQKIGVCGEHYTVVIHDLFTSLQMMQICHY